MSADLPTVLIVEDEPLVRMDAIASFEDAGFEVVEARTAEGALKALQARPDVQAVFTDVRTPSRLDGVELARLVHRNRPDISVIVTSGMLQLSDSDLPGDGRFVSKPYNPDAVAALARELLARAG